MTLPATAQISAGDGRPASPRRPTGERRRAARRPVERILPRDLLDELENIARSTPVITRKLVGEVESRFSIESRHGVSRRRLHNYLQRICRESNTNGRAGTGDTASAKESSSWPDRLRSHRKRQASVASILDATFGPLGKCSPTLWDRRAYLMLVGLVYERLSIGEEELPTDEVVMLAKVLAEARRVDVRARETGSAKDDDDCGADKKDAATPRSGSLPDNFADVVRQVYGTNFHEPDESRSTEAAPA